MHRKVGASAQGLASPRLTWLNLNIFYQPEEKLAQLKEQTTYNLARKSPHGFLRQINYVRKKKKAALA